MWAMTKKTEIVESFKWGDMKKQLLKEDKVDCPKGFIFDEEVDNCVKVQELPELTIVSFENDKDGSIRKSYNKFRNLLLNFYFNKKYG